MRSSAFLVPLLHQSSSLMSIGLHHKLAGSCDNTPGLHQRPYLADTHRSYGILRENCKKNMMNYESEKIIILSHSLYFFTELKTYHLSYFCLQTLRYRHCWSWQYAGRVTYERRNRPSSPWSLCGSEVEHRSAESEGLRFDSSWTRRKTSFFKKIFVR